MSNEPPFYLVWNEYGFPPRHKHESVTAAENEAERLAAANPGTTFYVLTPTCRAVERRVLIERFDPLANEIPF
jgi:hypothetical protein